MKPIKQAWRESAFVRDWTLPYMTAGIIGVMLDIVFRPADSLWAVVALGLLLCALLVDTIAFVAALVPFAAWERRMEAKRFAEFRAGSASRVDKAIANYESERCATCKHDGFSHTRNLRCPKDN